MTAAVDRYLTKTGSLPVHEVPIGPCRLDIVAYDRKKKMFKVIECKRTKRDSGIGRTFGQTVTYITAVKKDGLAFARGVGRKLAPLTFDDWMEATEWGRQITVAFYVALSHEALSKIELIRDMKRFSPDVGIIRVKQDGSCRSYIHRRGKTYHRIAAPRAIKIKIRRPG